MRVQSKRSPPIEQVPFGVNVQAARLTICEHGIHTHDQGRIGQIRREVESRSTQVDDVHVGAAFVFGAKALNDQGSEAIVAEQYVTQADDARRFAVSDAHS